MSPTQFAPEPLPVRIRRKARALLGPMALFLKGFVQNPVMVGALVPSSGRTIRRVLAPVDWDNCRVFVEYGPGVGTFCRPVLDRLRRDGTLIVIDTNPDFIAYLKATIRDSRFSAVLGSAADVGDIVAAHGFDHADYVLSGLPFSTLPPGVGPAIMAATQRVLRSGGAFLVYQYTTRARQLMTGYFPRIDKGFEPVNVPPCVISWGWKD
jgi:phospholipid N-methyltransferase